MTRGEGGGGSTPFQWMRPQCSEQQMFSDLGQRTTPNLGGNEPHSLLQHLHQNGLVSGFFGRTFVIVNPIPVKRLISDVGGGSIMGVGAGLGKSGEIGVAFTLAPPTVPFATTPRPVAAAMPPLRASVPAAAGTTGAQGALGAWGAGGGVGTQGAWGADFFWAWISRSGALSGLSFAPFAPTALGAVITRGLSAGLTVLVPVWALRSLGS